MPEEGRIELEMDKGRLLADFRQLTRMMEAYGRFLDGLHFEDDWRDEALSLLKAHQALLARTRTSLRAVDLAGALLRRVLARLSTEQLTFAPASGDAHGHAGVRAAEPAAGALPSDADLQQLVARLNAAARTAPPELQEKVRFLLAAIAQLFRELLAEDRAGVQDAMDRINLLTANRQSQNLLREIALITRDVVNTLNAMSDGLPIDSLSETPGGLTDAVGKLNNVILRLEDSASRNLDNLDILSERVNDERGRLDAATGGLRRSQETLREIKAREPALADALTRMQERLSDEVGAPVMTLEHRVGENADAYLELIANQGFHDLAGNTLKRIIAFIESLELQLYELLKKYKPVLELETPRAAAAQPAAGGGHEATQDEVDALLDELGF